MQTYTTRRNLAGDLCNNSASDTLSIFDKLMNLCEKRIISARDWDFLWRKYTKLTVASQQAYKLPAYTQKPQAVYITVSSQRYVPIEVVNRDDWNKLNQTTVTSDSVTHYFVSDGEIEFFPIPATSSNVITFNARRIAKDLSSADYAVGTIVTVATSGVTTTVTGSGTTWGAGMIGRYIKIAEIDASNGGDGFWYEIATVPSSTSLTLIRTYGGTAITAGSSTYTIGQVSLLPEPHDSLPIFEALKIYFTSVDPNPAKASLYNQYYIDGYDQLVKDQGSKVNVVVDTGDDDSMVNPNNYVTL